MPINQKINDRVNRLDGWLEFLADEGEPEDAEKVQQIRDLAYKGKTAEPLDLLIDYVLNRYVA